MPSINDVISFVPIVTHAGIILSSVITTLGTYVISHLLYYIRYYRLNYFQWSTALPWIFMGHVETFLLHLYPGISFFEITYPSTHFLPKGTQINFRCTEVSKRKLVVPAVFLQQLIFFVQGTNDLNIWVCFCGVESRIIFLKEKRRTQNSLHTWRWYVLWSEPVFLLRSYLATFSAVSRRYELLVCNTLFCMDPCQWRYVCKNCIVNRAPNTACCLVITRISTGNMKTLSGVRASTAPAWPKYFSHVQPCRNDAVSKLIPCKDNATSRSASWSKNRDVIALNVAFFLPLGLRSY